MSPLYPLGVYSQVVAGLRFLHKKCCAAFAMKVLHPDSLPKRIVYVGDFLRDRHVASAVLKDGGKNGNIFITCSAGVAKSLHLRRLVLTRNGVIN